MVKAVSASASPASAGARKGSQRRQSPKTAAKDGERADDGGHEILQDG
uniref:Uncharacterized protein n=1 Tax=Arundo donax TaxID=35708 RepID=A0A0A9AZ96_ARUDO